MTEQHNFKVERKLFMAFKLFADFEHLKSVACFYTQQFSVEPTLAADLQRISFHVTDSQVQL